MNYVLVKQIILFTFNDNNYLCICIGGNVVNLLNTSIKIVAFFARKMFLRFKQFWYN